MKLNPIELIARIAISFTFIGHGIYAIGVNPKWIKLITTFGFSVEKAILIMPYIGVLDLIVALLILVKPSKALLFWMIFWAFITALSRVISGDSILELIERSSNWGLPLVYLLYKYFPNSCNTMDKT